ncbi:MAG: DUF3592 domain-containing protein [Gammaproteobacteria bacterium]|nr:DUF3592 domain-containing protein [Gammaproteobacteria bacterium]
MRKKFGSLLFALPFFGVGVWAAWSIGSNVVDAWRLQDWTPVEATLIRAGYETHSGDDSNTYRAYATYRYFYDGRQYENDRVAIAGGSDNIGDFQQDTGRRLQVAMSRGDKVTAYVNPENPAEALLDRSMRWGLLGFKSIFMFVFGGIGLGLLIYLFRAAEEKDASAETYKDRPWLLNDDWQSEILRSNSKSTMAFAWGLAALWNLISAPLPFLIHSEFFEKGNKVALIGLLFPIVGLGLLVWALRQTLEWRRFGAAPLTMDPFPGSIGGHVGGTIDLNLPYSQDMKFALTLTHVHSYISGSGKHRSRRENAKWQDVLVAHSAHGGRGTRLSFRFDVPSGLTESDAIQGSDDYYLWRLSLQADLPGVDINRDYEIPVYATAAQSVHLAEYSMQQARAEQTRLDEAAIRQLVNLTFDQGGRRLYYPMGRSLMAGLSGVLFGGIFSGAGWFLAFSAGHGFMGSVFGFVGSVILLSGLYFTFNSLEVRQSGDRIESVRRLVGIPVRRRSMRRSDFRKFFRRVSMQTQSGGKHVLHYSIAAVDRNGNRIPLGDGFRGERQVENACRIIGREFGLVEQEADDLPALDPGIDPLGSD